MNTSIQSKHCPACGHHFIPWRVWQITRWSCLRCTHCGIQLNRRLDWQFLFMSLAFGMMLSVAIWFEIHIVWRVLAVIVAFALAWFLDAMTVRLVVAGRWRGLLGYEARSEGSQVKR